MLKEELDKRVAAGYVDAIKNGKLTIYNYSNECVFEQAWDAITMQARGLVLDEVGNVIGRPLSKFFNMGERPETMSAALPAETPELSKKYDGSLIVSFWNSENSRWQAVTRGCWDNIQTQYANMWLETNSTLLDRTCTYMWELCAPWNRIVVAYKDTRMVLIGIVNTQTGEDWSYKRVREWGLAHRYDSVEFENKPIGSVDLSAEVHNEEGFVARFSNGFRVKLKYSHYLVLHKILTGLSVKGIWESLFAGIPIDLSAVPDEFLAWYKEHKASIENKFINIEKRAKDTFAQTPQFTDRKSYALHFQKQDKDIQGILFLLLDNKEYNDRIWKLCKPNHHETFQRAEE
jgi:RNA ligase